MAKVAGTSVVRGVKTSQGGAALQGIAAGAAEASQRREHQRQFNVQSEETKRQFDGELRYKYDQLQEMARQGKLNRAQQEKLLKITESGLFGRQSVSESGLGARQAVSEEGLGARQAVSERGLYGRQAQDINFKVGDREARLAHDSSERGMDRNLQWKTSTMQDRTSRYSIWAQRDTRLQEQTRRAQAAAKRLEFEVGLTPIRNIAVSAVGPGGDVSDYSLLPPDKRELAAVTLAKSTWDPLTWDQLSHTDRAQLVARADAKLVSLPKLEERYAQSVRDESLAAAAGHLAVAGVRGAATGGGSGGKSKGSSPDADDFGYLRGAQFDLRAFDMPADAAAGTWATGTGMTLNMDAISANVLNGAQLVESLKYSIDSSVQDATDLLLLPVPPDQSFMEARAKEALADIEGEINLLLPKRIVDEDTRDWFMARAGSQVTRAYFGGAKKMGMIVPTEAGVKAQDSILDIDVGE
jgi:hypothetical protein